MRVDLIVPFAEKDEARRAGAQWDMARKVWYAKNLENLEPLLQWVPERLQRPVQSKAARK